MTAPRRLSVLLTHPVQYFKPVFQALAAEPDLDTEVLFGCDHGLRDSLDPDFGVAFRWDSGPTEGFAHRVLSRRPLADLSRPGPALALAARAVGQLRRRRPDAVLVFAYSPVFITAASLGLAAAGLPLLLRADGTDRAFRRSAARSWLKDRLLRRYYRLFAGVFPIGSDSDDHFARLGVPARCRRMVPFAVDHGFFEGQRRHWGPQRHGLRRQLGIPDGAEVLLTMGKMTPVKAPLLLADAVARLEPRRRAQLWLIAVGDGPLRGDYQRAMAALLPGRCHCPGFQNQTELGRWYALADTLVFPSVEGETWGLVVNEALQFGLRVVASDHVGCARDLLTAPPHRVFTSGSAGALAEALAEPAQAGPPAADLPRPEALAAAVAAAVRALPRRQASSSHQRQ
jgi:glycosyltransferase involved in cell wall biosynthesis